MVEGRTLTSVNRQLAIDELDSTALEGENRIVLSKQLDTKGRHFKPYSSEDYLNCSNHLTNSSSHSIVSVKAFAATNSSGISKADLEAELNKELENSIPMIIEELDKAIAENKRQKEKIITETSLKTTTKNVFNNDARENENHEEINLSDLNKLIKEGLEVIIII